MLQLDAIRATSSSLRMIPETTNKLMAAQDGALWSCRHEGGYKGVRLLKHRNAELEQRWKAPRLRSSSSCPSQQPRSRH